MRPGANGVASASSRHRSGMILAGLVLLPWSALCAQGVLQGKTTVPEKVASEAEPTRTISFETDQGTWTSLDLRRDGEQVVFDLLGDLYTIPITGGTARRLTSGPAFDAQPRYAPDGRHIVFVSDRSGAENVWTADVDGGNPRQITHESYSRFVSPRYTPDGSAILVSRHTPYHFSGSFELWQYHMGGGRGVRLTRGAPDNDARADEWQNAVGAAPSPDGRFVYYAAAPGQIPAARTYTIPHSLPLWQVRRLNRWTGQDEQITTAAGSAMRPEVSGDGKWLAYATRNGARTDLRLRDLRTSNERLLVAGVQRDGQESFKPALDLLPGYAFTPDNKAVILSYGGRIHSVDVGTGARELIPMVVPIAQIVRANDRPSVRLDTGPVVARIAEHPTLSPDGRRLAFGAFGQLYVMALPAGRPWPVATEGRHAYQPAWSPDGDWLAYVTWTGTSGGAVWRTRVDGRTTTERLTRDSARYRDPTWNPSGTRIVALRMPLQDFRSVEFDLFALLGSNESVNGVGGAAASGTANFDEAAFDLVWIPATGGAAQRIAAARGLSRPHFGPDSLRIFLSGGAKLVSVPWDGAAAHDLLGIAGNKVARPDHDMWPVTLLSPDGRFVLALYRGKVFVAPMPWIGGERPILAVNAPPVPLLRLDDLGADAIGFGAGGREVLWWLGSTVYRTALADVESSLHLQQARDSGLVGEWRGTGPRVDSTVIRIERPRARSHGALALIGARIITMRGEEVLDYADLLVVDGRIAAVGPHGAVPVPAGATRISLTGRTIVPGFIDLHPHVSFRTRHAVLDTEAWPFANYLAYGVTTGRDPQTDTPDIFVYEDLIASGIMPGMRSHSTGPGILPTIELTSLKDAHAVARRYKEFYRTGTIKSFLIGNRRQQQWLAQAAREAGLRVSAEGGNDYRLGLTQISDGVTSHEHMLPAAPLFDDAVQLLAKSGVFYVPAVLATYGGPYGFNQYVQDSAFFVDRKVQRLFPPTYVERRRRSVWVPPDERVDRIYAASAAAIAKAGGRVCIGSHGDYQGLGFHWNLWALADGGLTVHEILRAATVCGADALGLSADIGSIEVGKVADIVILTKNPLEDIRNTVAIEHVMRDGRLFDANTLDTVWPERRPMAPFWWWDESRPPPPTARTQPRAAGEE